MNYAEARSRLEASLGGTAEPVLSEAELDSLLSLAATKDAQGRVAADSAWAGAWNLNHAAAEGWAWKAAKVAGDFTFSADGASFDRSAVYKQCLDMAKHYKSQAGIVAVQLMGTTSPDHLYLYDQIANA